MEAKSIVVSQRRESIETVTGMSRVDEYQNACAWQKMAFKASFTLEKVVLNVESTIIMESKLQRK